jgi:hypothetical protein
MASVESVKVEQKRGETHKRGVWIDTNVEVTIKVAVSEFHSTTITERFVSHEEASAWSAGVVRGIEAASPLWAVLSEERLVNGGAK